MQKFCGEKMCLQDNLVNQYCSIKIKKHKNVGIEQKSYLTEKYN